MLLLVIQVSSLFIVSFSFLPNACTNVSILSLSASNGSIKNISQRNQGFYVQDATYNHKFEGNAVCTLSTKSMGRNRKDAFKIIAVPRTNN